MRANALLSSSLNLRQQASVRARRAPRHYIVDHRLTARGWEQALVACGKPRVRYRTGLIALTTCAACLKAIGVER